MMHRLNARRLIGTTSLALSLGLLADPAPAQESLTFISWQAEDPAYGPWWRGIIEEFNAKHPDVAIEFTQVPRDSYADQMTTLFASGSPPEIVHLASFEYPNFAELGWLENLDPWIEEAGLDLDGWAGQGKCVWNGDTVCLMLLYFGTIMAYNEAMFEEAGLEVPTTYDDYLAAARALTKDTDGDGLIDQYGVGLSTSGGPGQYLSELLSYVVDAGGNWSNDQGEATLNTPEMIEALSRWKTTINENLTPLDLASGDIRQLFIEGKIAQRVDGPWLYGIIQKAEPEVLEQIKLAAPPFHPPMGGSSNILAMPSEIADETKQLVWDFIQIAASEEQQRNFAELGASPAPRPDSVPENITDKVPHFDLLLTTMKEAADAGVDRMPTGFEVNFNEFSKMIQEEVQRMLIEDLDPAETAARMQERAEAL